METPSLTRTDWLDLALAVLRTKGHGALKAQPLAKALAVTRGSFYYHFDSLAAFHDAVVLHWAARTSGPLVADLDAIRSPTEALARLLQTTLVSGEALERAVRSWAIVEPPVARAVDAVDRARIAVAEDLLRRCGLADQDAVLRARLLYWAAIGRLMMPDPTAHRPSTEEIDRITALVLTAPEA